MVRRGWMGFGITAGRGSRGGTRIPGRLGASVAVGLLAVCVMAGAETCTTQSAMTETDRNALAGAARGLAEKFAAGDAAGVLAQTIPDVAKDAAAVNNVVGSAGGHLKGATLVVEQVYLLDASDLKLTPDGAAPEAQFLCSLNHTVAEADFTIPSLPPGKYGFAMVDGKGVEAPWRISFLLREDGGQWKMAGVYPKALTAAGHDGLWYWTEARTMLKNKEHWNAWLYYRQAESLLNPAGFLETTHLDKLRKEISAAAPPQVSEGVSAEAPLVVKGADGVEYHFIGLGTDDSLAKDKVDVTARLKVDAVGDPVAAKKRNEAAMAALVGAYPEMRKGFHGVWVFAEAQGQNPYATELAMNEIH